MIGPGPGLSPPHLDKIQEKQLFFVKPFLTSHTSNRHNFSITNKRDSSITLNCEAKAEKYFMLAKKSDGQSLWLAEMNRRWVYWKHYSQMYLNKRDVVLYLSVIILCGFLSWKYCGREGVFIMNPPKWIPRDLVGGDREFYGVELCTDLCLKGMFVPSKLKC